MESYGVNHHIIELDDRQTTIKQRYRTIDKTVFKLSKISQNLISEDLQHRLFEKIKPILQKSQILIFSDFNYGCLPQKLVNKIVEYALLNNVFIAGEWPFYIIAIEIVFIFAGYLLYLPFKLANIIKGKIS